MTLVTYLVSAIAIAWISSTQAGSEQTTDSGNIMTKVILTVHGRTKEPTVDELMEELGLSQEEIDRDYGVQMIDPVAGDYVILVDEEAAKRVSPAHTDISGPYANPEIEPFGPPE